MAQEKEQLLKMTQNGQVTIPASFRKRFPNADHFAVIERGEMLIIEPRVSVRPGDEWAHTKQWEMRVEKGEEAIAKSGTARHKPKKRR